MCKFCLKNVQELMILVNFFVKEGSDYLIAAIAADSFSADESLLKSSIAADTFSADESFFKSSIAAGADSPLMTRYSRAA